MRPPSCIKISLLVLIVRQWVIFDAITNGTYSGMLETRSQQNIGKRTSTSSDIASSHHTMSIKKPVQIWLGKWNGEASQKAPDTTESVLSWQRIEVTDLGPIATIIPASTTVVRAWGTQQMSKTSGDSAFRLFRDGADPPCLITHYACRYAIW